MNIYDFIEIGTSDFNTEIEKATDRTKGISIEPIKQYLDNLPNPKNCIKVEAAISDYNGLIDIYYVSEENIKKYKLPPFVRGCNSVSKFHPTVLKYIKDSGGDPNEVFTVKKVKVMDFEELAIKYNVGECKFLKIDTEGHDCIILQSYIQYSKKIGKFIAKKIMFETNRLNRRQDIDNILNKLQKNNYVIIDKKVNDIVLEYIPDSDKYIKVNNSYLKGYPLHFDPKKLPYENTFEAAMKWALTHKECGGITFQDGKFEARKGNKPILYDKSENLISWYKV